MVIAHFASATRIESENELRSLFRSDRVSLSAGASVTFEGEIVLGVEVGFSGDCRLSGATRIENGALLSNVRLGRNNVVRPYSILSDVVAGDGNLFGPFCFIRDNCEVGDECILGAHVETTRSIFGSNVKISHRAFVGDAAIGARTIIGAGVVFCNFDGKRRQSTTVGSGVTVGSGSLLIPPLHIGNDAVIGAGSTVTKDVAEAARIIQRR